MVELIIAIVIVALLLFMIFMLWLVLNAIKNHDEVIYDTHERVRIMLNNNYVSFVHIVDINGMVCDLQTELMEKKLQEAIDNEDFNKAAKLKNCIQTNREISRVLIKERNKALEFLNKQIDDKE